MLQLSLDFIGRQFDRFKPAPQTPRSRIDRTIPWKQGITVQIVFRSRARRYLLRLQPDGTARLVIPRRGSEAEGIRFLEKSEGWLFKRREQWHSRSPVPQPWGEGTRFLFRGEDVTLRIDGMGGALKLSFADQSFTLPHADARLDHREVVLRHLRVLAERELPVRTRELAQRHGISINRITVRAQKTRWGSCSARGTISLNWRLIHAPPHVVDYLIVHELMHRREMNHSPRYWKLVANAFPDYRRAEKWLKECRLETMS